MAIKPVTGKKRAMGAIFNYGPLIHDNQAVKMRDGRQTVGNGDHRLTCHQLLQAILNHFFTLAVQGRRCLIKDKNGRVLENSARNRDTLPGQLIKYKYQPAGAKDSPRFPVYIGLRSPIDM